MSRPKDRERTYGILFDLHQQFLELAGTSWNIELIFDDLGEPEFFNSDIPTIVFQEHDNAKIRTDLLYYFLVNIIETMYGLGVPEDQIIDLLNPFTKIPKKFVFKKFNLRRVK